MSFWPIPLTNSAPRSTVLSVLRSLWLTGLRGQLSAEQIYNLSMIVSSGHRLTNLVNDILDFSKLKYQELILNLKPVDLHAMTEVVLILSQPLVGSKSLELDQ